MSNEEIEERIGTMTHQEYMALIDAAETAEEKSPIRETRWREEFKQSAILIPPFPRGDDGPPSNFIGGAGLEVVEREPVPIPTVDLWGHE